MPSPNTYEDLLSGFDIEFAKWNIRTPVKNVQTTK